MHSTKKISKVLSETQHFRKSSIGLKALKEIFKRQTSFFIYRENYRLLKKTLKINYKDLETITSNNQKRVHFQKKIIKDIYNTITSARSFIEYFDEDKSFLENDFDCFMKELRNFIVHQNYIPLISKLKHTQSEQNRFESFNTIPFNDYLDNQINKFPKRHGLKKAKLFIKEIGNEPSLNNILRSYNQKLHIYYKKIVMEIVLDNYDILKSLIQEVEVLNIRLKDCNLNVDTHSPITEAHLRYLKLLIQNKETA
ncbi:hypothetical protein [Aestuariibaculum suncheonense]|uniref:Uncharacterized protein n=1 Tax=Aestuariibaculum suncheonense TaxID=1028745 RepID=A0A8J6UCS4_9FLAO|nr:hypothetical protein [Aestuariibaculum suncheonense]MBD0836522.1 hypothetical protein [Aestuariibaculum suncheonense]